MGRRWLRNPLVMIYILLWLKNWLVYLTKSWPHRYKNTCYWVRPTMAEGSLCNENIHSITSYSNSLNNEKISQYFLSNQGHLSKQVLFNWFLETRVLCGFRKLCCSTSYTLFLMISHLSIVFFKQNHVASVSLTYWRTCQ